MISITNLSFHFGSRTLYDEVSLHIKPKDRIGLIGANGTGKSTLLKLITGEYQPDGGTISKAKDCTIGFLNQDLLSYQTTDSILHVAMQAFEEALQIQERIEKVLHAMEAEYSDKLLDELTSLQEKFDALDGYTIQSKAEEVLEGLGFNTQDLQRPLKEFSGGWRMRVMLAKLLLQNPALLMLDEPTNHLDLPSIQWIEQYLNNYEGAVIIVSHDREFLNNAVNKIVEVRAQQLNEYNGNYAFYLEERELREEIQKNAFENQQAQIRQTERFIERFRAKASKARQVQSRVKQLERMDLIDDVVDETAKVNFKFNLSTPSGRHVITLEEVSKSFGDLKVLSNTTAKIEKGDKIALVGANGKGKSTLLRILFGSEPIEGKREEGYNVRKAFFAQHQLEALRVENNILEELKHEAGASKNELELRSILGCFLFSNDDVFKKIKVLSGGEKSRVAMAKILVSEANFLLLDEPTNHLDMVSVNILIQALQQYEGTFIAVSHDRYFVTEVANKIWFIENHELKEYPGTFQEYQDWMEKRRKEQVNLPVPKSTPEPKPVAKTTTSTSKPMEATTKKSNASNNKISQLESQIAELEKQKASLEIELTKPEVFGNHLLLAEKANKLEAVNTELDNLLQVWEEALS